LPLPSRLSFRGAAKRRTMMCNCTSENLEIPRCAITHLRSGANAPSRNDGINAAARRFTFQTAKTIGRSRILGLVVRDARRCRAPHHEGLADLILRSRARRGVSKDVAPTLSHRSHEPPFSRRGLRPSHARILRLENEGAGNAGCPPHPQPCVRVLEKHTSVVTTGPPETPGISLRNGFNSLYRALPGDRAFLPPSSRGYLRET
jgi:hypothetical protein